MYFCHHLQFTINISANISILGEIALLMKYLVSHHIEMTPNNIVSIFNISLFILGIILGMIDIVLCKIITNEHIILSYRQ